MRGVFLVLVLAVTVWAANDVNATDANETGETKAAFSDSSIKPGKTDTIVVKGAVLQGQVTGLNDRFVTFSLIYGRGAIRIAYDDIDTLTTEHTYHIFYKDKETEGRIYGLYEHRWLVIDKQGKKELVDVGDIDRFMLSVQDDDSLTNKIHNYVPFWSGNIDLGIEVDQGGVNKRQVDITGRFEYHRQLDRILVYGSLEDDIQETNASAGWKSTKDEYLVNLEENHYLSKEKEEHLFIIAGFERDAIREIQSRTYPAAGAGYKWTPTEAFWLMLQLGIGGVFNNYMTYGREYYGAAYTGAEAYYEFWHGIVFRSKLFYMPSILHVRSSWLFRLNMSLAFPLSDMFALKFSLKNVADNNPEPDIGNNKITTNFALSFTF